MEPTLSRRIGRRIQDRRESLGISQKALSRELGIRNRQTLSKIENGDQPITAEQTAAAAEALQVDTGYFSDPFHAAGEAAFSFRADAMDESVREDFEDRAGRWLATIRELSAWRGEDEGYYKKGALSLTPKARYEHAAAAARAIRRELHLGNIPARTLNEKLESELGIQVLYVDLPPGISGAASRMTGVQAILVNRNEAPGRRMFDLAHELFHVLTWDVMPPPTLDAHAQRNGKRVEELANAFASALLMPEEAVKERFQEVQGRERVQAIAALADLFQVTGAAMKWRLVNLGLMDRSGVPSDSDIAQRQHQLDKPMPQLFNLRFVDLVHSAVEAGRLSLRKTLAILGMSSIEFAELCKAYGRTLSYEV